MSIFTGSAVALITPFNPDGSVNFEKLKELIDTVKKYCPEHGHGILNEDGKCIILLNAIENQYYITLTKYGEGDLYISKKDTSSFIITGTPDLEFDWQVTAAQENT